MSLTLYYHPLASFCWKALIALYENDTPFEPVIVDLVRREVRGGVQGDLADRQVPGAARRGEGPHHPGVEHHHRVSGAALSGRAASSSRPTRISRGETRLRDRFYDLYVHEPMQKIVADRLRPAGKNDPHGVEQARAQLATAYGMIEQEMAARTWAMGDAFTMADCAAAPALFYADKVPPFGATHPNVARYLGPPDGAPVLRARARGSAALFRDGSERAGCRRLVRSRHGPAENQGSRQMAEQNVPHPPIASRDEWLAARKKLLAHEKELTKQRDRVNAERRRLPMVKIEKDYVFDGPGRQAEPAGPLRRPPPAHRLPLHVRPGVGQGLPGLHRLRRRPRRPVDAARPRHDLRARLPRAAGQARGLQGAEGMGRRRGSPRSAATSTTTSTSRSTRRSRPSSTTIGPRPRWRRSKRPDIRWRARSTA